MLDFKIYYHQYTWGLGGIIWAFWRYTKIITEGKKDVSRFYKMTKDRIQEFEKNVEK